MGGRNSTEGRVEIYYNGRWGAICDRDWDMNDATVACRSLGFPGAVDAPTGVCDITVTGLMHYSNCHVVLSCSLAMVGAVGYNGWIT